MSRQQVTAIVSVAPPVVFGAQRPAGNPGFVQPPGQLSQPGHITSLWLGNGQLWAAFADDAGRLQIWNGWQDKWQLGGPAGINQAVPGSAAERVRD
jgi:hypothetical protein